MVFPPINLWCYPKQYKDYTMISLQTENSRALLMAKLSMLAYNDDQDFSGFGFSQTFLDSRGSQAYFLWNANDVVVVCRGTQPDKFEDIVADIRMKLIPSSTGRGRIHTGFKASVDHIWEDLNRLFLVSSAKHTKRVWITGHSLGAAMASIITIRCHRHSQLPAPVLYTYGSPRVGNRAYVKSLRELNIEHHRWVNNADIVTRNPLFPYYHFGSLTYFDHNGNVASMTTWQRIKDRVKGFIVGIKKGKVNFFVNHLIDNYIENLEELDKDAQ